MCPLSEYARPASPCHGTSMDSAAWAAARLVLLPPGKWDGGWTAPADAATADGPRKPLTQGDGRQFGERRSLLVGDALWEEGIREASGWPRGHERGNLVAAQGTRRPGCPSHVLFPSKFFSGSCGLGVKL